jgi:hypothetical protein
MATILILERKGQVHPNCTEGWNLPATISNELQRRLQCFNKYQISESRWFLNSKRLSNVEFLRRHVYLLLDHVSGVANIFGSSLERIAQNSILGWRSHTFGDD